MKRNVTLCCMLLLIAANLFTTRAKAQVDVNDSLALVDLYNSTNGPNWYNNTNWLTTAPVSTWYGVSVRNNRVDFLYEGFNALSGAIPATIGNLDSLDILNLEYNQLSGAIPSSIGNLSKLNTLYLYNNQLSGNIPSSIGNLKNLKILNLESNQISGAIPSSVGNLLELVILQLDNNQLSGNIPSSIGNLLELDDLNLDYNKLSGSIPPSVGNLVKLGVLTLGYNQLSGMIPAKIGNLVKLGFLDLDHNQLSGTIPIEIGNLVKLSELNLNNNHLSGSIPSTFYIFRIYQRIDLSYNQLSQVGNVYVSTITKLTSGFINNNLFTFDGIEFIAEKYPNVTYAPQANITIHQQGNTLSVYAGGTLSNNTYNWHKAGTPDSTVIKADSTYSPSRCGQYYVTVTNKIATRLTLYSDTVDFIMSTIKLGSNMLLTKPMQVYPNPAKDVVHVQVNGTAMIAITNSDGKVLLTKSINNSNAINISALAPGIYYLQNKTSGEVQKVVVVH
jgi:Leucine-rich repeat (LRR) protein